MVGITMVVLIVNSAILHMFFIYLCFANNIRLTDDIFHLSAFSASNIQF